MALKNLKKLRNSRNLTAEAFVEKFNEFANYDDENKLKVSTYQRYEQGKFEPKSDMLIKIADFYDVSIDYLFGREKTPQPVNIVDKIAEEIELDNFERIMLGAYLALPESHRKDFAQKYKDQLQFADKADKALEDNKS
jgi:transcriptional regulator with XRE-family HTH domain